VRIDLPIAALSKFCPLLEAFRT